MYSLASLMALPLVAGPVVVALAAAPTVHSPMVIVIAPVQGEGECHSDAVVSLVPQEHRLFTVFQVVEADDPEALVISHFDGQMGLNGSGESQQQIDVTDYCEEHSGNGVICFITSEVATIGETFAVRDIAAQESWATVTVVMTRWHAFRAHYIFEQCVDNDIDVNLVHSDSDVLSASDWPW